MATLTGTFLAPFWPLDKVGDTNRINWRKLILTTYGLMVIGMAAFLMMPGMTTSFTTIWPMSAFGWLWKLVLPKGLAGADKTHLFGSLVASIKAGLGALALDTVRRDSTDGYRLYGVFLTVTAFFYALHLPMSDILTKSVLWPLIVVDLFTAAALLSLTPSGRISKFLGIDRITGVLPAQVAA
jgi:hypothetical protein